MEAMDQETRTRLHITSHTRAIMILSDYENTVLSKEYNSAEKERKKKKKKKGRERNGTF